MMSNEAELYIYIKLIYIIYIYILKLYTFYILYIFHQMMSFSSG